MDLTAQTPERLASPLATVPVVLMLRPACGLPGDHVYSTDSHALLSMLKQQTELPTPVLERFMTDLRYSPTARLRGVELDDRLLKRIGYFVD